MGVLVKLAIIVLGPVLLLGACNGCGPSMPTLAEQKRVGTYGAELAACVELAKTLEESKACRAKVSASFGRDADAPDAKP